MAPRSLSILNQPQQNPNAQHMRTTTPHQPQNIKEAKQQKQSTTAHRTFDHASRPHIQLQLRVVLQFVPKLNQSIHEQTLITMQLFLLLLAALTVNARSNLSLTQVDQLRWQFFKQEENLWNNVLDQVENGVKEGQTPQVELIKQYQKIGDAIDQIYPDDLTFGLQHLEGIWSYAKAYADLRGIFALYESFRRFQSQQTDPGRIPSPPQAWTDLTDSILRDSKNNVKSAMARIDEIIISNLFLDVKKEMEGDMICNSKQSPQQVLYNLYNAIALTELKGYIMMQFSYMLLRLHNKGNFTQEAQEARDHFQERIKSTSFLVAKAMESTSRSLWNCDPKKHVKGETYEEITQLLQGYVQNEVDLNPEGTCRENCAEYTFTKSHGCYQNLFCRQQRKCNGNIIKCQFVDSDMWICPASINTGRRYEYIEYENGRVLGRKKGCSRGVSKVDSWWRWLFWHCSYCFCYCDEQGPNSDRYINMRATISDIKNNMVVTGLRFVKKNRIIHLQIQEGKLLPRGEIARNTVKWVPVEEYQITDRNVYNGQDFHTLTWDSRAVDLDDLHVNPGYILTGVRFKKIGTHLNFEIYMTPFNFETGLLGPEGKSEWKDNPNTDASLTNPRTRVKLNKPDIPINTPLPSVPDSLPDQYIEFTHTDMDRDAAQTTVPFLDAQPVESLKPVPLAGAGLFHKGRNFFGGFITPKVFTYDFSGHLLLPLFPDDEIVN